MMRTLRFLLLGCLLLGAQYVLAAHGIDHALHEHDEACVECLSMPGFSAVPAKPPYLHAPVTVEASAPRAVPPAPTFARVFPFHSRAPPPFQST